MARLTGLDPSQMEPDLAERAREQLQARGRPSESGAILARRPPIARAWSDMFAAFEASGRLSKALRHLVNRRVAMRVGCAY